MITIANAERINYSKLSNLNQVLSNENEVQRMLSSSYTVFGQSMNKVAVSITITLSSYLKETLSISCTITYLIGMNYLRTSFKLETVFILT